MNHLRRIIKHCSILRCDFCPSFWFKNYNKIKVLRFPLRLTQHMWTGMTCILDSTTRQWSIDLHSVQIVLSVQIFPSTRIHRSPFMLVRVGYVIGSSRHIKSFFLIALGGFFRTGMAAYWVGSCLGKCTPGILWGDGWWGKWVVLIFDVHMAWACAA